MTREDRPGRAGTVAVRVTGCVTGRVAGRAAGNGERVGTFRVVAMDEVPGAVPFPAGTFAAGLRAICRTGGRS
ncbi:hypothetical protein DB35_19415 [Streptomyces abyssalis]|uniref:Uncharacterized protein n=1 Tax=Streptomyces abyssalis TaxID=933944 RepID=A0A1E7JLE3_9ACTN|nr:hypothetical protein [Streptomyces abyssalis]OEU88463.1 hypothetical protein AN215_20560 [Streptomyces abyssalis]OEU89201.1 hypothetical protein DB35_19415 [Streptomyces abyssalis]